jgi:hypothetical protein
LLFSFKDLESKCLPTGNGYLGASVLEKVRREVILNEHTL